MKNIVYLVASLLIISLIACDGGSSDSAVNPNNGEGKGGSTARFTIVGNYLYTLSESRLTSYDISVPQNPIKKEAVQVFTVAETLFPFRNNLLMGTQTGMFVYSLETPSRPQQIGTYSHFVSCDPVVAEGNVAYVTLRDGTTCQRGRNQLDILDISTLSMPKLVRSYPMENPHGLGIAGNLLFVGEGAKGLKVFDRSNPIQLNQLAYHTDIPAVDVIAWQQNLIVTGLNGVYQYSFTPDGKLTELSKILVSL